ncbi:MAG: hypothetical protein HZA20_11215 [Nitrospirae bacterium]|nr:hypothetical protein [Nitrospirota bacterium]
MRGITMRGILIALFVLALNAISAGTLHAGSIQIEPEIKPVVTSDKIEIVINITNKGNEKAVDVRAELSLGTASVSSEKIPVLEPGKPHKWTLGISRADAGIVSRGVYILSVLTVYHDANLYPFSMPTVIPVSVDIDAAALKTRHVEAELSVSVIRETGRIVLTLINTSPRAIAGRYALVLPRELETANTGATATGDFSIAANGRSKHVFDVRNQGALPGSSYRIFGMAEYDDAETRAHYGIVLPNMVNIMKFKGSETVFRRQFIMGIALIAVLLLITLRIEMGLFKRDEA